MGNIDWSAIGITACPLMVVLYSKNVFGEKTPCWSWFWMIKILLKQTYKRYFYNSRTYGLVYISLTLPLICLWCKYQLWCSSNSTKTFIQASTDRFDFQYQSISLCTGWDFAWSHCSMVNFTYSIHLRSPNISGYVRISGATAPSSASLAVTSLFPCLSAFRNLMLSKTCAFCS